MGDPVAAVGMEIFRLLEGKPPSIFDRKRWAGQVLEAAMGNPDLKVRLFRFIDVFPTLTTPDLLARHVREYFLAGDSPVPPFLKQLLDLSVTRLAAGVTAKVLRRNIHAFARNFIAGGSPEEALPVLRRIRDRGRTFTLDILGEAAVSEAEADGYRDRYLSLAGHLAGETAGWGPPAPGREARFPRLNVSVKISSLYSRIGPVNHEDSVRRVQERLRPVFRKIRDAGGFVNLDMETYAWKRITLDVFTGLLEEEEFRRWNGAGLALQAYMKDAETDLERILGWAQHAGRRVTIRLVKGAYWEQENIVARQKGWPVPVFTEKSHADRNFERCVERILALPEHALLAAGTHNVRSIAKVLATAERLGVPKDEVEIQMLYGMAEPIKKALGKMGHTVRVYVPVGELLPGMAYLVRRLLENSSNEGFLRRLFAENVPPEELLSEPSPLPGEEAPAEIRAGGGPAPFSNEPPTDFSPAEARDRFRAALDAVRSRFGREYPAVIDGAEQRGGARIVSVNPARPDETVGAVCAISSDQVERAMAAAVEARRDWARRPPRERAGYLFRAAGIARERSADLAAWQVFEVGKSWEEADADVVEAIDHLEYYGREMIRLGSPVRLGDLPGEENRYFYRAKGVGIVIAPWNFPLAISMGMVSAALVTGNAVLYKPSSLSPVNGWLVFSILREAGIPEGVLQFVPGRGGEMGNALVEHRDTAFVLFTGSRDVGLSIVERAGRTVPGQRFVKKVVAEMGGKNAVIVDADADLDLAVAGVMKSAFGYQGQKCSACSRAIVHEACCDRFLSRLIEAVRGLPVGPPEDPANVLGPVIDASAKERIEAYIDIGRREGTVAVEVPVPDRGYYVSPVVLTGLPRESRALREEIFGPVLSVVRVRDFDEALAAANDSEYALTGGLFSRSPANIARAWEEFDVGNLYLNRGITGAIVGRQPFGGFRMSGVGSKAGGFDYLLQFLEPRVVSENTMRRGFAPEGIP
jgi:RHH-type transcriptional regulator, proline utilization regulon repressor / proline dehydrogenase / delta 1-pyrroline-5-carboxylate dehydrogenase